jgi:hypothetical protein
MTICAISPNVRASTPQLLDEVADSDAKALPISGWRTRQQVQRNGRAAIEINDDTGDPVGLITSTNMPMLDHSMNVKNWHNGNMALRWCAAGMIGASMQFGRINGHLHLRAPASPSGRTSPRKPSVPSSLTT